VVAKARIVRHRLGSGAVGAHLRDLQRDGTTRNRERGKLYGPEHDRGDERGEGDRHSFRMIVALEDGDRLADLRGFTRDVMAQIEADLGSLLTSPDGRFQQYHSCHQPMFCGFGPHLKG
jgi:type IV secretory pathway VirD2 relaxase